MQKNAQFIHGSTVVGSRGQIVIPSNIRDALHITAGEEMTVIAKHGKIIVIPSKNLEEMYNHILGSIDILRGKQSKKKSSSR